jgi:uncharacterized glyoxalase superfamily protein PhnB
MPDVVPFLGYEDCGTAADWLVRAFGFEEVERFEEAGEVTHVTLRSGDGLVFLGHPGGYVNPLRLREQSEAVARMYDVPWIVVGVWLAVDDFDARAEQTRAAGARILTEPEHTPHGRQLRVEDPEGHRWMLQERAPGS